MIIGGGKMGQALARGFLSSGAVEPGSMAIVEVSESAKGELSRLFPQSHILPAPEPASSTILAVKPGDVEATISQLPDKSKQRVLSIAAGVSTAALEVWLGGKVPVIRAMPNTPAMLGVGMTALCSGRFCVESDLEWAERLMSGVGKVVVVKEALFDAVTAVSGSGPAYVFLVAEAMIDAAISEGLSLDLASQLVTQTIYGSASMLIGNESPTKLRHDVTSPGGTTAKGISALEEQALRAAFVQAISAASKRSKEIAAEIFKH